MKSIIHLFLPFLFLMGLSFSSFAVIATPDRMAREKPKKESAFKQLSTEEIFTMPRKDIETKIGRKLKFKEKLGLLVMRKVLKKQKKKRIKTSEDKSTKGLFSVISGSVGLLLFLLPVLTLGLVVLGTLFIIMGLVLGIMGWRSGEPNQNLSIAGISIGATFIGLILLILLIALIV